jgi:hypothetical protein
MNPTLFVVSLFPEKRDLPCVLGITEERSEALSKKVVELMASEEFPKITDKMSELSKICLHANELAFCCYALGHSAAHGEFMHRMFGRGM